MTKEAEVVNNLLRRLTLALGVVLLLLSAYPFALMARESKAIGDANSRYMTAADGRQSRGDPPLNFRSTCYGNRTVARFRGQVVVLSDKFKMSIRNRATNNFDKTTLGVVNIHINGRDYTHPALVEIRPEVDDENRYWMQVVVAEITDKATGKTRLALLQSFPRYDMNGPAEYDLDNMKCRILFVDGRGRVEEEIFRFGERTNPIYRALLASYVSPQALGLTSQMNKQWPSLFYPMLYPYVSGLLALLLIAIGIWGWRDEQS
jgi:hypothetical protein